MNNLTASVGVKRFALRIAQLLGMIWTLPNTLVGLAVGAVGVMAGGHVHWRQQDLALVFHNLPWGPGGALTLGNVILYTGQDIDSHCFTYEHRAGLRKDPVIVLSRHERAHVYQYMVLGPLFLPVYAICGGVSHRNRFEQAADYYAVLGRGWFPWPRKVSLMS